MAGSRFAPNADGPHAARTAAFAAAHAGASKRSDDDDTAVDLARMRAVADQLGWSEPGLFSEAVAGAIRQSGSELLSRPPADTAWALLRGFVNAAPDGIAVVDDDGRIVLANDALSALFRCPESDLVGRPVEDLLPVPLRERHAALRAKYASEPQPRPMRPTRDLHALRQDGSEFPVDICLSPFRLGDQCYVVAALRDATQRSRQQAELRRSEARFRAVFDGAGVGIAIVGRDGRIQSVNGALERMLDRPASELVGREKSVFAHPADATLGAQERREMLAGQREWFQVERRYVGRDGGIRHLRINNALVRDTNGDPDFVISVHEDVTEQRQTEQALKARTLDLLQLLGRAANEASTLEEAMQLCMAHVCDSLGWPVGHALVRGPSGTLVPSTHWHLADEVRYGALREVTLEQWTLGDAPAAAALRGGVPVWLDARPRRSSSPRRRTAEALGLVSRICVPVLAGDEVVAALEFFSPAPLPGDVGLESAMMRIGVHLGRVLERRRAHEQLEHLALHDALTGLPNRLLFLDRLQHALARLDRHAHRVAVYFMDVDGLKDVNDTLGHGAGDELLQAIAERLRTHVRPEDTVARLGGDEFTLLCEGITEVEEARVIGRRLLEGVSAPIVVRGIQFDPSLSVGVALVEDPEASPEAVLRDADTAMYAAKEHGGGRIEWASPELQLVRRNMSNRGRALRSAIEHDELRLHYQPCVSLPDRRIVGVEALVRWQHPRRGLLAPRSFVPLAEQNGLIEPLGDWVIHHACRQVCAWQRAVPGAARLGVQVNVSSRQFATGHLVKTVKDALEDTQMDPSLLHLEITETVMLEGSGAVLEQLRSLRGMGARISVDDFGTGYSSLNYLQQLPLQQLKLDRQFIARLHTDRQSQAIVASLIRLAHALDIQVVAEGVEQVTQCDDLAALGCDCAQGFLFGAPKPAGEVEALLRDRMRPGGAHAGPRGRAARRGAVAPAPAPVPARARRRRAA